MPFNVKVIFPKLIPQREETRDCIWIEVFFAQKNLKRFWQAENLSKGIKRWFAIIIGPQ
jgi:hypothetical protein